MAEDKETILIISDLILSSSGVAHQMREFVNALLETGKYKVICFGGAVKHQDYRPIKTEKYGDDFITYPVDGYGEPALLRTAIRLHKPDLLWYMSDPRFFEWLHKMSDEILPLMPIVWYCIWDNFPSPKFNAAAYKCNSVLAPISKVTEKVLQDVVPEIPRMRIPHAVNPEIFKVYPDEELIPFKRASFGDKLDNKFIFFWVNRNARRKMSGSLIYWFKKFLDKVGHDKATLLMHTDPRDPNGQDLYKILQDFDLKNGQILISADKVSQEFLAKIYNLADCTINISDAEGFGLCEDSKSRICCEDSVKKLEDVVVGDKVLSADGKFHNVMAKKTRNAETLKIKFSGNSLKEKECSYNHPFLVASREKKSTYKLHEKMQNLPLKWKAAADLKVGEDYFVVTKPKYEKKYMTHIDIIEWIDRDNIEYDDKYVWKNMGYSKYVNGLSISDIVEKYNVNKFVAEQAKRLALGKHLSRESYYTNQDILSLKEKLEKENLNDGNVKVARFIPFDDTFINFLGWYLAEGSNNKGTTIEIDLHAKEISIAKKFQKYFSGITTNKCRVEQNGQNKSRLLISSSILGELFGNLCGIHSNNKMLNPKLFNFVWHKSAPLIRGLFNGDGYHGNRVWSLTSTSEQLLWQVRNILLANNIFSSLRLNSCEVTGRNYNKFCEYIGIEKKESKSGRIASNVIECDEYFLTPIVNIEPSGKIKTLYDIQVEGSHNFISDGVVSHNSLCESKSCGTPIIATETGGMIEQLYDEETGEYFGIPIKPASKALVGSLQVPYIFEDRINEEGFVEALLKMYNMPLHMRQKIGKSAREDILKRFSFQQYKEAWLKLIESTINENGSWETRTNYKSYGEFDI